MSAHGGGGVVQVPFDYAVEQVVEQLKAAARGEYRPPTPSPEKRKFGSIVFAAVTLPVAEVAAALHKVGHPPTPTLHYFSLGAPFFFDRPPSCYNATPGISVLAHYRGQVAAEDARARRGCLAGKDRELEEDGGAAVAPLLGRAHVTLAHKRSHGVTAVASYGVYVGRQVPVELTALLVSDKLAAFEAAIGCVEDGEKISSKNEWPHVTVWAGAGASAKDANDLPRLVSEGSATRIDISPPLTLSGTVDFY